MSLAVFPAPPSSDVTSPVSLTLVPGESPETVTLKVQLLLAARFPPDNVIVLGEFVVVNVPPHAGDEVEVDHL